MGNFAPYLILGLTVGLSLSRPKIGPIQIHHSIAGVVGALLTVALGLVSRSDLLLAIQLLTIPVLTIVSLMVITLIAEQAGVFQVLTRMMTRLARGSGRRLFALLFICGTVTGTFFTNDAAVLIFTPLVFNLIEQDRSWTLSNKIPFYVGVLYIANLVGALVIANPINLVTASILEIGFNEYAKWMIFPAVVSMIVSFFGLRYYFRSAIPKTFAATDVKLKIESRPLFYLCAGVLALTLIGFFCGPLTGIPVWAVALFGALMLASVRSVIARQSMTPIIKGVGWDVIVFVIGIFIIALGLRNAGLAQHVGDVLMSQTGGNFYSLTFATGFTAAVGSAILDNHPTADIMAWVVRDFSLPALQTKILGFAALVGGDLGPKMSPIGSLAALMWLRLLRDRGVNIPYRLFLKVNIPITLIAVLLTLAALSIEIFLYEIWFPGTLLNSNPLISH